MSFVCLLHTSKSSKNTKESHCLTLGVGVCTLLNSLVSICTQNNVTRTQSSNPLNKYLHKRRNFSSKELVVQAQQFFEFELPSTVLIRLVPISLIHLDLSIDYRQGRDILRMGQFQLS